MLKNLNPRQGSSVVGLEGVWARSIRAPEVAAAKAAHAKREAEQEKQQAQQEAQRKKEEAARKKKAAQAKKKAAQAAQRKQEEYARVKHLMQPSNSPDPRAHEYPPSYYDA